MERGDVVTVAAGSGYGSKPRPAVIIQSDDFPNTLSVIVCLVTSEPIEAPLLRLPISPDGGNGLTTASWLMVDKLLAVHRAKIGQSIGRLAAGDMRRLDRALLVLLGLAGR